MTKNKKLIYGLIVFLVACWIYASPYLAVRNMKEAVKNGDSVALADYVNFPALKESLKASVNVQMTKSMAEMKGNPLFSVLGANIANSLIDPMFESLVSPEGLAVMMQGHKPDPSIQKEEKRQEARSVASDDEPIVIMGYENINRFTVKITDKTNPTQEVTMVFLRDGLSWNLCAVRFPTNYVPIKDAEDAKFISMESSSLDADPVQDSIVNLNALLRNHASYTLSYPDIELTFNDAQDKPLARRTFHPLEYIQPNEDDKQGLAANHELHVKLKIDTADLRPVGYRLSLFYPNKEQVMPSLYAEKIKLLRPQPLPALADNQGIKLETQQNNSSALPEEINEASSKLGLPPIYSKADFIKYFGRCDNDDAKTLDILRESMNAKTISTCVSLNDSACSSYVGVGQCKMIRAGIDNEGTLAFIMMTAKGDNSAFKPQLDFKSYGDGGSKYSTSVNHGESIQMIKSRWLINKDKIPLSIEVTSMNSTSGQLSITTIAPQHH